MQVIVCTHNPRQAYFDRALASIEAQSLDKSKWELLVIDNGSDFPVEGRFSALSRLQARVVREDKLGLTNARIRGVRESLYPLMVFLDDDNVLEPEYLERALMLHSANPDVAVFGAGRVVPDFEIEPAAELKSFLGWLALRSVPGDQVSFDSDDGYNPFGAGLCCTRELALRYILHVERIAVHCLDRVGDTLTSGGDMEFSWLAVQHGWRKGIFESLGLRHLIPKERLTVKYFERMAHDSAYSQVLLDAAHGVRVSRAAGAFRYYFGPVKSAIHLLRGDSVICRIASAKRKGYYNGCRSIGLKRGSVWSGETA